MSEEIIIVGTGVMAVEYAKVLCAMRLPFRVVGRGQPSAQRFHEATGIAAETGGLTQWLGRPRGLPRHAIVAVDTLWLGEIALQLMHAGVTSILLEKPGGHDETDVERVAAMAAAKNAGVFVAYNRRFFASTRRAAAICAEDGGVNSFVFEFTEWSHVIAKLEKEPGVKEQWLLANSSHVVDLAFHLGGFPASMHSDVAGALDWHPAGAAFVGSGRTTTGALFSYHANWNGPGRWGVEIVTPQSRLILRPLEQLQIQRLGSVALEPVALDDEPDRQFKPGLYKLVESFFGSKQWLPSIAEQAAMMPFYRRIKSGRVDA